MFMDRPLGVVPVLLEGFGKCEVVRSVREVFRSFREVFGRQRREFFLEMIDYVAAIDSVKKSSKSELSSQFFGRLKFL